jgi:hypothetical protein
VLRQDKPDGRVIGQLIEKGQYRPARDAKDGGDALSFQNINQCFCGAN